MSAEPPEGKSFGGFFIYRKRRAQRKAKGKAIQSNKLFYLKIKKRRAGMKKQHIICLYILFTIIVSLNASVAFSGFTTLSWDAPTTNADGTPLTDLAGYKVYYGTPSRNYSQNIDVGNVTTYTVDNLTEGLTYYFAVTAYDTGGNESGFSNEAILGGESAGLFDLPKTGQTVSYAQGDDGYIQAGIEWPNSRFTDNGDGTVTDNLTGLMWLKDGGCIKKKRWTDSLNAIADFNNNPANYTCLNYTATYSDWRLPNVNELASLIHYGDSDSATWLNSEGFADVNDSRYWSSTTHQVNSSHAWLVMMSGGRKLSDLKSHKYYLLPVRTGSPGSPYVLPKTGQTESYTPGDDGYIQAGIEWPNPRFTDNGNGTLTDNLTGLMWLKDGGCIKKKKWTDSLNAVTDFNNNPANYTCLEYAATYSDWRLPNVKELESLIHYGASDSAAWLNSEGFVGVDASYYWSSTTRERNTFKAWIIGITKGKAMSVPKNYRSYIWPVRGKQ
jgi:hypothetical protein